MRIQHNIAAMNSYRQLGGNNNMLSKNLEKLSSGYRINRAGDDAAGLAISEKMRAQIKGLETAQKNANDGISLVQTAEGALTEVHSMLNRMTELATQSANGTYDDKVDRENLQKEVVALKEEIDRISKSTNFNGIDLLNGTYLGGTSAVTLTSGGAVTTPNAKISDALFSTPVYTKGSGVAETTATKSEDSFYVTDLVATAVDTNAATTTYEITLKDGTDTGTAKLKVTLTATALAQATDPEQKVTLSAADLATLLGDATQGVTANGTVSTNAGKGTVKIDLDANGSKLTTLEAVSQTYTFAVDANTGALTITAKKDGSNYGVSGGPTVNAETTKKNAAGKTDTDQMLSNLQLKGDPTNTNITWSTRSEAQVVGTNQKDGTYVKSRYEFNLNKTGSAAHGTVFEFGTKKYILNDVSNSAGLTEDQKDLIATKGYTELKYNSTIGADDPNNEQSATGAIVAELKKAITNDTTLKDKIMVSDESASGKIVLTETDKQAKDALADPSKSITDSTTDGYGKLGLKSEDAMKTGQTLKKANQWLQVNDKVKNNSKIVVDGKTYEFVTSEESKTDENAISVKLEMKTENGKSVVNTEATAKNLLDALQKENGTKFDEAAILTDNKSVIDLGITVDDADNKVSVKNETSGLLLQVGDTSDTFNKVGVIVEDMSTKSLKIDDIDISTQDGASAAIEKIKAAINRVSETRGDLGAVQNRLEHTINNLGVTTENITAAESRIRDTDMASEMMQYTKNNILIQASQAMLAQANQVPQGVLQLLQ